MNRPGRRLLAAMVGVLVWSLTSGAFAFCRMGTKGATVGCGPGTESGKPLFWRNACVGLSVTEGSQKRPVSSVQLEATLAHAFEIWSTATCPGGGHPSIAAKVLPRSTCSRVGTLRDGPNQNVLLLRDRGWPHRDPEHTVARTALSFDAETGEIYGADIEVNSENIVMSCADLRGEGTSCFDGRPLAVDVATILLHEAGHFLGLAHSDDKAALMSAMDSDTPARRSLTTDDILAICTAYPPDGTRVTGDGSVASTPCDPTPRNGFSETCGEEPYSGSCAAGARGRAPTLAIALVLASSLLFRRRMRRPSVERRGALGHDVAARRDSSGRELDDCGARDRS